REPDRKASLPGNPPGPATFRHADRRCAGGTAGDQEDGRRANHLLSADLPPELVFSAGQAWHVGLQPEGHSRLRPLLPRGGGRGDAHLSRLSPAQPVTDSTVTLRTADGLSLEVRRWQEDTVPHRWTFVIVHGLGEHSGRYQHLAARFTPLGATVYAMDQRVPAWKRALSTVLPRIAPGMTFSNEVDASLLSHDPGNGPAYTSDPLVHDHITAGLYGDTIARGEEFIMRAPELRVPFLLMQGRDDQIVDPVGSQRFFARAAAPDRA